MTYCIKALAAFVLGSASASALAAPVATATASASSISFTVYDLDPFDGSPAGFVFLDHIYPVWPHTTEIRINGSTNTEAGVFVPMAASGTDGKAFTSGELTVDNLLSATLVSHLELYQLTYLQQYGYSGFTGTGKFGYVSPYDSAIVLYPNTRLDIGITLQAAVDHQGLDKDAGQVSASSTMVYGGESMTVNACFGVVHHPNPQHGAVTCDSFGSGLGGTKDFEARTGIISVSAGSNGLDVWPFFITTSVNFAGYVSAVDEVPIWQLSLFAAPILAFARRRALN